MRVSSVEVAAFFGDALDYRTTMRGGPEWLCSELLATPAARAKLEAWLAQAGPAPWTTPDAGECFARLAFTGDQELAAATALVLATLPPPVVHYVLAHATVLGVGHVIAGWCSARPDFGPRPFMIVLGPGDGTSEGIRRLVLHETAHAWLSPEPPPGTVAAGAVWMGAVYKTPLDEVPEAARAEVLRRRAASALDERQADALTAVWLATTPPLPSPSKEVRREDPKRESGSRPAGQRGRPARKPRRPARRAPGAP